MHYNIQKTFGKNNIMQVNFKIEKNATKNCNEKSKLNSIPN